MDDGWQSAMVGLRRQLHEVLLWWRVILYKYEAYVTKWLILLTKYVYVCFSCYCKLRSLELLVQSLHTWKCCSLFFFQEEFASYEANDPFSQTLMVQVDGLLGSFTSLLTEENYKALVGVLVSEVAEQLEKAVFKSSFNRVRFLNALRTKDYVWSIQIIYY